MVIAAKMITHWRSFLISTGMAVRTVSVATANVDRITPIAAGEMPMRAPYRGIRNV